MQPHTLINRLAEYNIPARLQLFVLDFLTDRKQYVHFPPTINTGAPQGCVLCYVYQVTNAHHYGKCKIIYADDTVVIGLINNDNDHFQVQRHCILCFIMV